MAMEGVGLKVFLNLLLKRPIETKLNPIQHEAVKKVLSNEKLRNEMLHYINAAPQPKSPPPLVIRRPRTKTRRVARRILPYEILPRPLPPPPPPPPPPRPQEKREPVAEVDLPAEYIEFVRNKSRSELKLVHGKELFGTDVSGNHDRVTMPPRQIWREFLMAGETDHLAQGSKIRIRVFDPSMEEYHLKLAIWNGVYSIHSGWKHIVGTNCLETRDPIQIWSFGVNDYLCFLVQKLP